MPVKKIAIQPFLELARLYPILDVRSPGEYKHAKIPGAYSLPLFNDEERKVVGTAYKQQGKSAAIKIGLDFFGPKMKPIIEEVEKIFKESSQQDQAVNRNLTQHSSFNIQHRVLVHCWRGGMRSAGIAWLMDLYGFEVYTLIGGYKAYRNWVLTQFEKDYQLNIIGGYTGSGKTDLLEQLKKTGHSIIDLEKIANHKGSAFGDVGEQPTQEMFENLLAENLHQLSSPLSWIEDESQRIGRLNIPPAFWKSMRSKPVYFIEIPFIQRLDYIMSNYGLINKEKLVNAIIRIQKRLGPLETKTAITFLIEDNYKAGFEILLQYYDKLYNKSLYKREDINSLLNKISCPSVDAISNTEKLFSCAAINI